MRFLPTFSRSDELYLERVIRLQCQRVNMIFFSPSLLGENGWRIAAGDASDILFLLFSNTVCVGINEIIHTYTELDIPISISGL